MGEVTITRKLGENDFAILFDQADAGVKDGTINLADEQTTIDSGFRIFARVSSDTGSGHLWLTFRNATFDSHQVSPTPTQVTEESITFKTNLVDVRLEPYTASTTLAEL